LRYWVLAVPVQEGLAVSSIRLMIEADLSAVRQVDVAGFGAWWGKLRGPDAALSPRRIANLAALRQRDPEGCFVALEQGRVVGYLFSRTWGGVGWLGPLAVAPDHQRRGIGRDLILAGTDYLRRDPSRVAGLETMPEEPGNVGFYLRLGFHVVHPTVILGKPSAGSAVAEPSGKTSGRRRLVRWSEGDGSERQRWLDDLR